LNATPDKSWSLDQLGEYCRTAKRKMAVIVWRVGRALLLAKSQYGKYGDWGPWLKRYCSDWSRASISRYMSLAKKTTEDQLVGIGVTDAYKLAGIRTGKSGDAAKQGTSGGKSGPRKTKESSKGDGGAGEAEAGDSSAAKESAGDGSPSSEREGCSVVKHPAASAGSGKGDGDEPTPEQELRELLSNLARILRNTRSVIADVKEYDAELRDACWRDTDRDSIRTLVSVLRDDLAWLQQDIPQEAVLAQA
jgi:hypothetical protein